MRGWTTGERLLTRGYMWSLLDMEAGSGCTALHLARELEPDRTATLLAPFDRFEAFDRVESAAVLRPREWRRLVKLLGATAHPAGSLRSLASSRVELMPHQLEPALAVVRLGATRLLIADAVGLGKTIQAALIAAELASRVRSMRALILVPAGLRDQWKQELSRHFALNCTIADAAWLRAASEDRPVGVNPWTLPGLFLASIDFVKRPEVLRPLEEVAWDLLVVDEAHAASSRSDRRAAAHAIAARARIVVLLTATPPADDPHEYQALCTIGRVDAGESPIVWFRRTQADVTVRAPRKSRVLVVRPSEAETRMHALLEEYTRRVWRESRARGDQPAMLAAIVLRKRALSSAASLAASVRRRIELLNSLPVPGFEQLRLPMWEEDPLEDEAPAAVLAAPGLANASLERRWLALIAEAARRAAAAETKIRFLKRMLRRVREPVIVFTEYRDTLLRLKEALSGRGRAVRLLHGGMRPAERTGVQSEFNTATTHGREPGGRSLVLLATDAAAEGLNLHERCRTVVHFELPWSTSRLEQRAGRVDRLGQRHRVHETGLIAATSAERLVLAPLLRRALRAGSAGAAPKGIPAALNESHVAEMIIGDGEPHRDGSPGSLEELPANLTRTVALPEMAQEEVRRARYLRTLLQPSTNSGRAPDLHRPALSTIRRRYSSLRPGVIAIFLLALSSRRSRVHAEPIVLWLPHTKSPESPLDRRRTAREIRRTIEQIQWRCDGRVSEAVSTCVRRALEHATRIEEAVQHEWTRRDAFTRSVRTYAARRLVQQGLFERRRGSAVRPDSAALEEHDSISAALPPILSIDVRLAAALLVLG